MMKLPGIPDLQQLQSWVYEAETAHSEWRRESWTDARFRDGAQWTEIERQAMLDKGINPLTINRIFPIINMITGNFVNNRHAIEAVGRTQQDAEISQVMSEAIAFVMDNYGGYDLLNNAFQDQIVTGFGALGVGYNGDPRKERVMVQQYPWYSIWWDSYADPWLDPSKCRYVFYADWKDLDAVIAVKPQYRRELEDQFAELTSGPGRAGWHGVLDEGSLIEEKKNYLAGNRWADKQRRRIRPVELWYTHMRPTWFAVMADGTARELEKAGDFQQQYQLIEAANSVVCANVRQIRVATFVGNLILEDRQSPYPHNQYPFVPFVGYLDSYRFPFGVPRNIREMQMEVNKRRSMALALISNRRVIMERNTAEDSNAVYEEANRQDGLIILNDGKSDTFQIQEMQQLSQPQIDLLRESEREIQEITGANNESLGYKTTTESAVALENKQQQATAMTASQMQNLKASQRKLGEQITSLVQESWTEPKVMRVTDRATGAERFAVLNDPYFNPSTGAIEIKNNIVQGRFDIVISDRPMTDTVRQKNLELLFSGIQKSPPEMIPPMIALAFELSDLPNKDQLLHQLRLTAGVEPVDPLLTTAEAEAKAAAKQQEIEAAKQAEMEMSMAERQAEIEKTRAETEKLVAEAKSLMMKGQAETGKVQVGQQKVDVDRESSKRKDWIAGQQMYQQLQAQQQNQQDQNKEAANA